MIVACVLCAGNRGFTIESHSLLCVTTNLSTSSRSWSKCVVAGIIVLIGLDLDMEEGSVQHIVSLCKSGKMKWEERKNIFLIGRPMPVFIFDSLIHVLVVYTLVQ